MTKYNPDESLTQNAMRGVDITEPDELDEDDELKPDPEEQAMYKETSFWNDKEAQKTEEYNLTKGE